MGLLSGETGLIGGQSPTMQGPHQRKCWDCGNTATHQSSITPGVLCGKCGSQDTRRIRERDPIMIDGNSREQLMSILQKTLEPAVIVSTVSRRDPQGFFATWFKMPDDPQMYCATYFAEWEVTAVVNRTESSGWHVPSLTNRLRSST